MPMRGTCAQADQAVCIGGPLPAQSLPAHRGASSRPRSASGADAVHPGYGFLAENADFAQACSDAGLVFIGPSPEAIARDGRQGRRQAADAGGRRALHPRLPGRRPGRRALAAEAERIGFPVMIKAAAGGGGRGMRLVRAAAEFAAALRSARVRGARAPSATRRVILERAIVGAAPHRDPGLRRPPRQRHPPRRARLLGAAPPPEDDRGGAVAGGRCRRCASAWARRRSAAAQAIGYDGAGTLEFLLDARAAATTSWR